MTKSSFIGRVAVTCYAAFCAATLWGLPVNKYQWMLEDPALRGEQMSFCSLPLDPDSAASTIALLLVAPLFVLAVALSIRQRRWHYFLWLSVALLAMWMLRFWILTPSCPGRVSD